MKANRKKRAFLYILYFILVITIVSFSAINTVYAEDVQEIKLQISESGQSSPPLFTSLNEVWYPDRKVKQDFVIVNNTEGNYTLHNIKVIAKVKDINGKLLTENDKDEKGNILISDFCSVLKCRIYYKHIMGIFNKEIYNGSFEELHSENGIEVNPYTINKKHSESLYMEVYMDKSAGNEIQGLQADVDIVFNSRSDDSGGNNGGDDDNGGPHVHENGSNTTSVNPNPKPTGKAQDKPQEKPKDKLQDNPQGSTTNPDSSNEGKDEGNKKRSVAIGGNINPSPEIKNKPQQSSQVKLQCKPEGKLQQFALNANSSTGESRNSVLEAQMQQEVKAGPFHTVLLGNTTPLLMLGLCVMGVMGACIILICKRSNKKK